MTAGARPEVTADLAVTVVAEVAVVALDRPAKLNALTRAMRRDLATLLRHYGDGRQVRGVVLTGRGRAFSAGPELRETATGPTGNRAAGTGASAAMNPCAGTETNPAAEMDLFNAVTLAALAAEVPVVAAVGGLAVGGAAELALSLDARVGTAHAAFAWPANGLGLTVSNAASLFLPRLTGGAQALRLVMEGARVDALRAWRLGLLDELVGPDDDLVPAAVRLIHRWTPPGSSAAAHLRLLRPSPHAVRRAMRREKAALARTVPPA
ncbi:enoyl-CoA hydratase/isomerase family protein [Streptomyces sp. JW3]|uniref:enoyl-CoA hydratase/isomerase family protein n=1 Tax=Streptomyces sp. JW3 TaxID=3456955 RepID=UPI003FA43751